MTLLRLLFLLVIVGAMIWLALNWQHFDSATVETFIHDLGPWAALGHVVFFALGTVLFFPGAAFGLAGGALFGPLWGTILNLTGATLGATVAFLLARYLAADWIRAKAGQRLERLIAGVESEGWRFVALVRLVPLFPFSLLNYALGLTRIPLTHYVVASLVCMVPGTFAYTWLGHAGRQALSGNEGAVRYGLVAIGLLAIVAFLPRILHRWQRRAPMRWIEVDDLHARLMQPGGLTVVDVRSPEELAGPLGCIAGALNVPVEEFQDRTRELSAHTHHPVVLVCRTDKRSASAATLLHEAGFGDVLVLRGGMERWNQHRLPVVRPDASGVLHGA